MTTPQARPLLNNEFAPVTFEFGFVESSFSSLCDAFQEWFKTIHGKFPNLRTEFTTITAPLTTALLSLEPLTNPSDRYLLVETNSNWTAVFANGLRVNDVASATGYLPRVLNCRGLEVGYTPDFSKSKRKDLIRKWGSTHFTLYGPKETDWLNRIRHLHVSNDVGGWSFDEGGEVQPFEEPESYKKPLIRDRFTPENDTVERLVLNLIAKGSTDHEVLQYGQLGRSIVVTLPCQSQTLGRIWICDLWAYSFLFGT